MRAVAVAALLLAGSVAPVSGQVWLNADTTKRQNQSNFRPLEDWPAPNEMRAASGAPGSKYWQQQVDYVIQVALDTADHRLRGSERVTYRNNSPDKLNYVWFQLDQNIEAKDSRAALSAGALPKTISPQARRFLLGSPTPGGYTIGAVRLVDAAGKKTPATYRINGTQMRVDLDAAIGTGQAATIEIEWTHVVPDGGRNGRGVREKLKDGWLYENAQWFPRAAVYDDVNGWQTDQFLGQGEFYLEFGNYDVSITVPRDHIVRATGALTNAPQVLTPTQLSRLTSAWSSETPVYVVRPEEVGSAGSRPAGTGPLTWRFKAERVRDFAWASSRGLVWDAMGFRYKPGGRLIELHSVYPREAMPLWNKISTLAIKQTMVTYGRLAFEYPYPQASNVHGAVFGMEYPMIAFCGARPRPDGTYDKSLEYALAAVTIHEVGHNWFPMIVASDERKHTWMDEGLNSYLEHYASLEFDPKWPQDELPGRPANIVGYMKRAGMVPITAESDLNVRGSFGANGYTKPASGLVMLREKIIGPSAFDQTFREYSQRWMFKKPQPADFFRSIEDGAGEQLNWFWRGWFNTTYTNDQAIGSVEQQDAAALVGDSTRGSKYNRVTIRQEGGLVMPAELEVTYADGTKERIPLPADIWRRNEREFTYGFFGNKEIVEVVVDPDDMFADVKRENNSWRKPVTKPIS
jgi:hypothetical protein